MNQKEETRILKSSYLNATRKTQSRTIFLVQLYHEKNESFEKGMNQKEERNKTQVRLPQCHHKSTIKKIYLVQLALKY